MEEDLAEHWKSNITDDQLYSECAAQETIYQQQLLAEHWFSPVSDFQLFEACEIAEREYNKQKELDLKRISRGKNPGRPTMILHGVVLVYKDIS